MAVTDHRPGITESAAARVAETRSAVAGHQAADEREAAARKLILEALDELHAPFDRAADLRHVTASAVVVGRRGTVLHRHKRLRRWLQPGGHFDGDELPPEAARREAEEETGLVLAHPASGPVLIHVDVHPAADDHMHLDLRYLLEAGDDEPAPAPQESQEVRWFSWEEALAQADEALVGALRAARRAQAELP